ncbi:MAG: PaaI family thioesterase [Pseudomonadota bacterium]
MDQTKLEALAKQFVGALPHSADLKMDLEKVGPASASVSMPWQDDLVGDPFSGVIHGGAVSALIDTTCGLAAVAHPENSGNVATLNLRIDYMRPAKVGRGIRADATCYHVTQNVAFVRAEAHDGDPECPVATAAAAFTFKRKSAT